MLRLGTYENVPVLTPGAVVVAGLAAGGADPPYS